MNRRELYRILSVGDELAAADITALGLAAIPSALSYTTLKQVPGGTKRARVTFGKDINNTGTTSYDSFAITKGSGSTGSSNATGEFLDFPAGAIVIHAVLANLTISTTITSPTSPYISIGTAAAGANVATPSSTTSADNIVAATALSVLTSSVTDTFNVTPIKSGSIIGTITNNTAGTATNTWTTYSGTFSTDVTPLKNQLTTIATVLNAMATPLILDGTSTAKKLFLNFACNSDPGSSKVIKAAGTIDVLWSNLGDV